MKICEISPTAPPLGDQGALEVVTMNVPLKPGYWTAGELYIIKCHLRAATST